MPAALDAVRHRSLRIETRRPTEFVDITDAIADAVRRTGFGEGFVMVQTRHTTTGLLVNEHEPLLLEDLEALFERLAPAGGVYAHDDFRRRTVNMTPGERRNGHAHCRAALVRASECVAVTGGLLGLGRWQRVFFVDFDGGQHRTVSLTFVGT